MTEFPELMRDNKLQSQGAQRTPSRINTKNINVGILYPKCSKANTEKNIEKSQIGKISIGARIRSTSDFLEAM